MTVNEILETRVVAVTEESADLKAELTALLNRTCDKPRFQDFVNQAISQKYDGIVLSHGKAPYASGLVKR
jgi:simple sugar transport system substrate-binding protein